MSEGECERRDRGVCGAVTGLCESSGRGLRW